MHLVTVLKGQAVEILPAGAAFEEIIEALQGCYRDHQLASAYRSHLKFWIREDILLSAGLWTRLGSGTTGLQVRSDGRWC
jgi:hypothetical protein